MPDLFGNEIIRTLGLYQPFAGLMLPPYNKIETRWVADGKKPPFPLGKYLIYATQKSYSWDQFLGIAGVTIKGISEEITHKSIFHITGKAIAFGELIKVREMTAIDMHKSYVQVNGSHSLNYIVEDDKSTRCYTRYCLIFKNMKAINPFDFKGKQGVGILTDEQKIKLQLSI